jgi:pantothenate kinase-related protein Tda10
MDGNDTIIQDAIDYAKSSKKEIAQRITSKEIYAPETNPVSVFMAGSPGAGKTEASLRLLERITDDNQKILRIDSDDLRSEFKKYNGKNSHLFQSATSLLVEKIHDFALKNKQSFLLDGTFASENVALKNIERSLNKNRFIQIYFVYQDPLQAWNFVRAREKIDGRKIQVADFINKYLESRRVVNLMKAHFGKKVQVDILIKDIDGSDKIYKRNVESIDNHIKEKYTKKDLEELINKTI